MMPRKKGTGDDWRLRDRLAYWIAMKILGKRRGLIYRATITTETTTTGDGGVYLGTPDEGWLSVTGSAFYLGEGREGGAK